MTNPEIKEQYRQELLRRMLIRRHEEKRDSLVKFIKFFFKEEKNKDFDDNWHYYVIEQKLKEVLEWKCTRLIINIPPGSWKTELITKCFPVWMLGKDATKQIIVTGYSAALTQNYGSEARDYYKSQTFRKVFPERPLIRQDQDTKWLWKTDEWGYYMATWAWWSITGNRANIFIIDDPIKPDDSDSDIKRVWINNWFDNTVASRLFNPLKDAIIIIMQRTHEDDLCWHLMTKEAEWHWDEWEKIILPAIALQEENHVVWDIIYPRKEWDALQEWRYPLKALNSIKKSLGNQNFGSQYQQNPINKESQEFHQEWFKYYEHIPENWRIFSAVDPAFSKKTSADYSCIMTGKFIDDALYVLEYTVWRFNPWELIDKMVYHIRKWEPEKFGIESVAAQVTLNFSLKLEIEKKWLYTNIEEIRQHKDKESKIRRLVPLYRAWKIYHQLWMNELEEQLIKFPRWSHDDMIDSLQMLYNLYELQPNTRWFYPSVKVNYDQYGRPVVITN